jgi:hypothetical protein
MRLQRFLGLTWLAFVLGLLVPQAAVAHNQPSVDVYTMGPGDDLFSRFGHAAICVTDDMSPLGRCYNYGTADFSTPGPLTWGVLRGHGRFWVSVLSQPRMMAIYRFEDRTVYRQRLPLPPAQLDQLIAALHLADHPEQTLYNYRHFDDNCTTRIRDLIDQVTGGALRHDNLSPNQPSLRSRVETGFATSWPLLALQQAVLGRRVDAPISGWDSMFLPEVLRSELQQRLHAKPEVLHARSQPLALPSSLSPLHIWLLATSVLLLLTGLAGRVGTVLTASLWSLLALVPWSLLIVARLPELRINEAMLVLWPTDILLLHPATQKHYGRLRLGILALVGIGKLVGLLVQPLWGVMAFVALPLLLMQVTAQRR